MNQFIVLEGVDGTGKTTIGKRLAKDRGMVYMKTPSEELAPVREVVDRTFSPMARMLFYLSSVAHASSNIARTLETDSVVCDRYVWSTFVPHAAYNGVDLQKLTQRYGHVINGLVMPHHTVLLQVDEDEQLRRIKSPERGGKITVSDAFCLDTERRKRVRTLYEEVADRLGWIKINTTYRSIDSVLDEINTKCLTRERVAV